MSYFEFCFRGLDKIRLDKITYNHKISLRFFATSKTWWNMYRNSFHIIELTDNLVSCSYYKHFVLKVYHLEEYGQLSSKYSAKDIIGWEELNIYTYYIVNRDAWHFHNKLGNCGQVSCYIALFYIQVVKCVVLFVPFICVNFIQATFKICLAQQEWLVRRSLVIHTNYLYSQVAPESARIPLSPTTPLRSPFIPPSHPGLNYLSPLPPSDSMSK